MVTVTDMGGTARWGPSAVDKDETISRLSEVVECANGSFAFQLLLGDRILENTDSLASLTSEHDLLLNMYVMAADIVISEAVEALQQCPNEEQIGTKPSPAGDDWGGVLNDSMAEQRLSCLV